MKAQSRKENVLHFFRVDLNKPDGRKLWLYSLDELPSTLSAPQPRGDAAGDSVSHLRWHALRAEWVTYAVHRQLRTFWPGAEWNPLGPTVDDQNPTELPQGPWQIAVFENKFPTFSRTSNALVADAARTPPALGSCEVVVFGQDPTISLGALPLPQVELLLNVWIDRTRELGSRSDVQYVFPFENRGAEVGVTLPHPHGQIYAYPFVPPIPARQLEQMDTFYREHRRGLLDHLIRAEIAEDTRVLFVGDKALAFVPYFARHPYEVWVAPRQPVATLLQLTEEDIHDLARALKTTLLKYDALWGQPFPYILVLYQAPTDGIEHPEAHAHFEIFPVYRMRGRLKYLAGSELGAGAFTVDMLPEQMAAELKRVEVKLS